MIKFEITKQEQGLIAFNYKQMLETADEIVKEIRSIEHENIAQVDKTKKEVNRIIKALDSERLATKKQFMKPLDEFESQIKTVISKFTAISVELDSKVKEVEEARKQEKYNQIESVFNGMIAQSVYKIPFNAIYDAKWLNKTCTDWLKQIEDKLSLIDNDVFTISRLVMEDEVDQATSMYMELLSNGKKASVKEVVSLVERFRKPKKEVVVEPEPVKTTVIEETEDYVEEVVEETETVAEEEVVVEVVEEVINEQMVVAFKVAGTKQQLIDLTNYMKQNNIRFQKLEV